MTIEGDSIPAGELTPAGAARALADAVRDAGIIALAMFRTDYRIWNKGKDSPVTEADIAVDQMLRDRLRGLAPHYAWHSEESLELDQAARPRAWVVDPIDGTRSFIKGLSDWSIAAAVVENGRPIAAALFAPVTDELFVAVRGGGATRNGVPIRTAVGRSLDGARIAGPRASLERLAQAGFAFDAVPRIHSLALRFTRVASGELDVALASAKSHDWDLAAADLLVHEAGGMLTRIDGTRPAYGRPDVKHEPLAAADSDLHPALLAALESIASGEKSAIDQGTTRVVEE